MHTVTCYPLGNADTTLIELEFGKTLIFDYADRRNADDDSDRRIDLPSEIRERLDAKSRTDVDVLAVSHLDEDHVDGASEFFRLDHASHFQGDDRIGVKELWVPAAAITESRNDLCDDARAIQAEARYRLERGEGIRVFSRPHALADWLNAHGLSVEDRRALITDAGEIVPGFDKLLDGAEFFAHSPFASRENGTLVDRNSDALVQQVTFYSAGSETRMILASDAPHDILTEIVEVTRRHANEERLEWDLFHLPHHCSYLSLGPEKGDYRTEPVPNVAWLFEEQGAPGSTVISPSDPIPSENTDQPPHRQAARYYKDLAVENGGEFIVTMEHPSVDVPEPLVIEIGAFGAKIRKRIASSGSAITSRPAPRAG